jgi:hypothetical protein
MPLTPLGCGVSVNQQIRGDAALTQRISRSESVTHLATR